jgi:hypothetical protein
MNIDEDEDNIVYDNVGMSGSDGNEDEEDESDDDKWHDDNPEL